MEINIGDAILFFSLVGMVVYMMFSRTEDRTEIRFIKLDIKELQKDVQTTQIIAQQVAVAGSAGPKTVENLNITGKLSSVLLKRFDMAELKIMADDLELNGSIEWASQLTAVQTILKHMYRHDKLIEIIRWIDVHREDIKL